VLPTKPKIGVRVEFYLGIDRYHYEGKVIGYLEPLACAKVLVTHVWPITGGRRKKVERDLILCPWWKNLKILKRKPATKKKKE